MLVRGCDLFYSLDTVFKSVAKVPSIPPLWHSGGLKQIGKPVGYSSQYFKMNCKKAAFILFSAMKVLLEPHQPLWKCLLSLIVTEQPQLCRKMRPDRTP